MATEYTCITRKIEFIYMDMWRGGGKSVSRYRIEYKKWKVIDNNLFGAAIQYSPLTLF